MTYVESVSPKGWRLGFRPGHVSGQQASLLEFTLEKADGPPFDLGWIIQKSLHLGMYITRGIPPDQSDLGMVPLYMGEVPASFFEIERRLVMLNLVFEDGPLEIRFDYHEFSSAHNAAIAEGCWAEK